MVLMGVSATGVTKTTALPPPAPCFGGAVTVMPLTWWLKLIRGSNFSLMAALLQVFGASKSDRMVWHGIILNKAVHLLST